MSARFELRPDQASPHPVFELRGEVDATNAGEFERRLRARFASVPVVLDLSCAAYFDSAGFDALDRLSGTGSVAVVIAAGSVIRRAASLVGIPFHDTVSDAAAALTPQL